MRSLCIAGTRMVVERRYSVSERNRADKVDNNQTGPLRVPGSDITHV